MLTRIKRFRESLRKLSKRDLAWFLLLANVIIWAVAYNQTNKFYNHYVDLLINSSHASSPTTMTDTPKITKTLRTESQVAPQIGSIDWIRQEWENAGADWEKVYAIMQCESHWDNNKYNVNTNGTIDLGIYMFNSVHIPTRLSLECASDPICSTNKAIELYEEQGWTPWVCADILNIK